MADDQTCHHGGQGCGNLQFIGQGEAAADQGQGNQDLYLIVLHTFEHPISNGPDQQPENQSTHRLFQKQRRHRSGSDPPGSGRYFQYDQKKRHCDTVIE